MTEDSLEKILKDNKILTTEIINILMDRLSEGVVFVNNEYKIVGINNILEHEFGRFPNVGEPYFDFFFGLIPKNMQAEYPISKAFNGEIQEPFVDAQLVKNNNYYSTITYPLSPQSGVKPNLIMEIWSLLGTKEYFERCEAYKEGVEVL